MELANGKKAHRFRANLDGIAAVVLIAAGATVMWQQIEATSPGSGPIRNVALPSEPLSLDGAEVEGADVATVAIIEFSDFQCPFCSKFSRETLPVLMTEYIKTGKVKHAFRHLPLRIHADAQKAAEASECAAAEGKFWPMHEALFLEPAKLDVASLRTTAEEIGLSTGFVRCLEGATAAKVKSDADLATSLGVTATPTFFVGRVQPDGRVRVLDTIAGAHPLARFRQSLDKALKQ